MVPQNIMKKNKNMFFVEQETLCMVMDQVFDFYAVND